jgi:hypothetical protein
MGHGSCPVCGVPSSGYMRVFKVFSLSSGPFGDALLYSGDSVNSVHVSDAGTRSRVVMLDRIADVGSARMLVSRTESEDSF